MTSSRTEHAGQISHDDQIRVSNFFDINLDQEWKINQRGLSNTTYEIGDEYFLPIFGHRTSDQVRIIAKIALTADSTVPLYARYLGN